MSSNQPDVTGIDFPFYVAVIKFLYMSCHRRHQKYDKPGCDAKTLVPSSFYSLRIVHLISNVIFAEISEIKGVALPPAPRGLRIRSRSHTGSVWTVDFSKLFKVVHWSCSGGLGCETVQLHTYTCRRQILVAVTVFTYTILLSKGQLLPIV
jgi:hypothetical protein